MSPNLTSAAETTFPEVKPETPLRCRQFSRAPLLSVSGRPSLSLEPVFFCPRQALLVQHIMLQFMLPFISQPRHTNPPGNVPAPWPNVRILPTTAPTGVQYTTSACAMLNEASINNGSPTNEETRNYVLEIGQAGDEAGRIFVKRLGFPGTDFWNIVPLSRSTNRGPYSSVENQIALLVQKHTILKMSVRREYAPGATRPGRVYLFLRWTGNSNGRPWIVSN